MERSEHKSDAEFDPPPLLYVLCVNIMYMSCRVRKIKVCI